MENAYAKKEYYGDIMIDFMDGQSWEACLYSEFLPPSKEVCVILAANPALQKFSLHEICCLRMKATSQHLLSLNDASSHAEEIMTQIGTKHKVLVEDHYPAADGFFGIALDDVTPYKLIFFTPHGVKARCQIRPVGEILRERGHITSQAILTALAEQKKLKSKRVGEIIVDYSNVPRETIEKTIEKAYQSGKAPRIRVGDILIEAGLVTKQQVENALAQQEIGKKKKVGALLIENGLISEDELLAALATKFRMRTVDLSSHIPNQKALDAVPADVALRLQVFPVMDNGESLVVATSQPSDHTVYDNLRFYSKRKIELVVATSQQISDAIDKFYPKTDLQLDDIIGDLSVSQEDAAESEEESALSESDSKIVNLVNKILLDASTKGVSDVHFEPGFHDQPFVVRYRIDGSCRLAHQIPSSYKKAILSRLKIMSNLDISERRKPQSGKILIKYGEKRIEFRIEITPTSGSNEDAVLRILSTSKPLPLDRMGFSESNLQIFSEMLAKPYGIILCVGPTGSGKTTTLHSALNHINTIDRKIWTVEDPVEITQPGLRQVQVLPKIGLTFAEVLRSFLRADPDVIMIGEMRDAETAKTAIEASLTGHLVLSTLHTNNAPETIVRLIEMGMDPYNFADALLGILSQRLARRLCDACKKPFHPTLEEFEILVHLYDEYWYKAHDLTDYSENLTLWRKEGCDKCSGTGYQGRIALHELAVATDELKRAIKNKETVDAVRHLAIQDGMRTLMMDGVQKILAGLTDKEQVLKVCSSQTITDVRAAKNKPFVLSLTPERRSGQNLVAS